MIVEAFDKKNICIYVTGPSKDENAQRVSVIRATTDSPMSPPPLANITPPFSRQSSTKGSLYNSQRSLYEIFATMQEKVSILDVSGKSNY